MSHRHPLPAAFTAALPRLEAALSKALTESAYLPADERLGFIGRRLILLAAEVTPPHAREEPCPDIDDAELKRLEMAIEDAVDAAIDVPGSVLANVGKLLCAAGELRSTPAAVAGPVAPEPPPTPLTIPAQLVVSTDHAAVPLLMALDNKLAAALASGAIKLLRADFMKQSTQPHLLRRQDLETLEYVKQIAVFLKPDEAVALLRSNNRAIAALTYGWVTPDHPDETDEYLANVRRFLNHPLGAHIGGCFWDFGSLPQRPRSAEEAKGFNVALGCMGDVYASAMGTTVVRHRTIPKRPARLDGELVVLVDGGDVVTAEQAKRLVGELAKHGAVENVRREPGRLRVRLASHAAAEAAAMAAAEAAAELGAVAVFPFWNAREYEGEALPLTTPQLIHKLTPHSPLQIVVGRASKAA